MTTITILPDNPGAADAGFRAVAGKLQSVGATAGQALDALAAQLDKSEAGTLVVVLQLQPDPFFTVEQRRC